MKKRQIYEIVYRFVVDDESLTREDKQNLLKFFEPARPKTARTPEQWCSMIAPKENMSTVSAGRMVKDGVMYTTNGHMVFRITTMLSSGHYKHNVDKLYPCQDELDYLFICCKGLYEKLQAAEGYEKLRILDFSEPNPSASDFYVEHAETGLRFDAESFGKLYAGDTIFLQERKAVFRHW